MNWTTFKCDTTNGRVSIRRDWVVLQIRHPLGPSILGRDQMILPSLEPHNVGLLRPAEALSRLGYGVEDRLNA